MTTSDRTDTTIRPFRIDIPRADLDDLRDRLARTRVERVRAPYAPFNYPLRTTLLQLNGKDRAKPGHAAWVRGGSVVTVPRCHQ